MPNAIITLPAIVAPNRSMPTDRLRSVARLVPGIAVCGAVTAAATVLKRLETGLFGRIWPEALVLAILVGTLVRTAWSPSACAGCLPGISFSAKTLLGVAVVLLGASLSVGTILAAGPGLLFDIAGVVVMAPALLHLSDLQYGALAGLAVYAVPQVLAATAPVGALAVQLGTLVKLVRALMLGPVVLVLTLLTRRMRDESDEAAPHLTAGDRPSPGKLALHKLLPWLILGFLALAVLRPRDSCRWWLWHQRRRRPTG